MTIDELSVIDDTIQNQQIQIEANAEAISLKASQDEVDTLSGNISSMNTTLQILAGEIEMKVSSEELKQVDGRITNLSSDVATLRVSVDGMSSSVSSLQYDLNGVINRVSRAESSIEQNAEAIKQRVTRTEFEQIEIYRIVSVRYNNSGFQRYHKMSGLYRGDTTLWGDSSGNDRSYTLSIYDRSSRTWESHTRYDIYTDENEALLLAEHLNSLGNDKLIILVGAHAAEQNRLTNGLPKAIYRCGGSRDVFEVAWGNTRKEYILVGIAGMGEGKGNEYLSSTDVPWLDVQLIINGGNVQFNNYHENTLTRLTHAESSIEQNAEAITQRVTVSQYSTDQNGVITRLNDAESSIEHNAEAITQRITLTQLNNGLDRKGKLFRAVARAWNGGGNNRYPVTSGLHDEEGNHISYENAPTSSSDRSYILYVMNRSTENWVLRKLYDVYTTNTEATRLANDLARYDENYLVILIAGHSPERNRLAGGLPAQIRRCGGSREIFNESEGWGGGANYILIGIPGMGEGAGLEYFRPVGTTINYGGWLDVTFTIKDGTVDFGNNDGSLALSRVSRAESSITQLADKIELKVDVDGIVSAINLSKEGIRIQGSLIHLDGLTLIDNGIIQNAHIANLSATKITTGTMHGNRIQVNTLNGNRITAGTITADHLNVANLSAVSSNLGTVRAGRLLSNNNNMDLNLNTGNLTMQNANLTIANGAKIDFDDPGNRITYRLYDSTSSLTRSAGMGVGNRIGGRYPFVYIGTTGASELDTLNQFFTGLIVNTSAAIANDDAAISLNGNRVQLRNQATGFEKGVTFDWSGNNPTMSFMNSAVDYAYDIRTLNQLYVRQTFVVRNTTNQLSGWRLESAYSGQGRDITLRGLNGGSYNYQIGENSQTHAIRNIYLRNNPVVVSDSRLKTDIKANTLGLDFINSIETVTYQLTRDKDGTNTGVVAQNILSALDTHGSLDDYKWCNGLMKMDF
ncbi:gp58-like family protein [Bacillus sp. JCM 19034]|uniref:gp58-like family protein n=1 Tax=Bacillus sp. JCM 19034 TaxID=1481928 RepID=UPI00078480FF|nr:gp58-like family protein [Bacillus sp. JCM 19034]